MRTRVKICGITRVEDGVAAAHAGADAIGLVFWAGTPRCVTFEQARAIVAALPPFVTVVGLFVDPQPEDVRAALAAVPLDLLQFHGDERPELCGEFRPSVPQGGAGAPGSRFARIRGALRRRAGFAVRRVQPGGMPGGTGKTFDWTQLPAQLADPAHATLDPFRRADAEECRRRRSATAATRGRSTCRAASRSPRPTAACARASRIRRKIVAFIGEVRNADG